MLEKKNGEYCEYYKNGKIKTKGQYKDRIKRQGDFFDENGKML
jgi:antitoxin component YwqK of YwqJK toxin-antitoxin module